MRHLNHKKTLNIQYTDYHKVSSETVVNNALTYVHTNGIDNDKKLLCAAGYLVGKRVRAKNVVKKTVQDPWRKRGLDRDIKRLRNNLSKIDAWHRGEWRKSID